MQLGAVRPRDTVNYRSSNVGGANHKKTFEVKQSFAEWDSAPRPRGCAEIGCQGRVAEACHHIGGRDAKTQHQAGVWFGCVNAGPEGSGNGVITSSASWIDPNVARSFDNIKEARSKMGLEIGAGARLVGPIA